MFKVCYICQRSLSVNSFHKCRTTKDGLQNKCKECRKQFSIDNLDRIREYGRKHSAQPEVKERLLLYRRVWDKTEKAKIGRKGWYKSGKGIFHRLKHRLLDNEQSHRLCVDQDSFCKWYDATPKICEYCEMPEEYVGEVLKVLGGMPTDRLQVDRKDAGVGYQLGNIVMACPLCNMVKSNVLSYEHMKIIGLRYITPKWKKVVDLGQ